MARCDRASTRGAAGLAGASSTTVHLWAWASTRRLRRPLRSRPRPDFPDVPTDWPGSVQPLPSAVGRRAVAVRHRDEVADPVVEPAQPLAARAQRVLRARLAGALQAV